MRRINFKNSDFFSQHYGAGFSLVELIVALGIFGILAAGVFHVAGNSFSNFYGSGDRQQVTQFTQEAIEAVKSIRDNSWQDIENIANQGNKGLAKNAGGYWEFSGTSNILGDLTRVVGVTSIYRDASGNIVDSGGTLDPNTYKVTATTTASGMDDYVLNTILTNWAYKSWSQTNWSGLDDREFWSDSSMASSSYSNVSTSTAGELTLTLSAGTGMSWNAWSDLDVDDRAEYKAWEDFYHMYLGPDGTSLYISGTTNYDFIKYNIAHLAGGGVMRPEWKITVDPSHRHVMELHTSGDYAYFGKRNPADGTSIICVVNIATLTTDVSCYDLTYPGASEQIMDMVVNAAGDRLYVFDIYGYGYAFTISDGGATLSLLNAGEVLIPASGSAINQVYFDESGATDYFYLATDQNLGEFVKVSIDQTTGDFANVYTDGTFSADLNDIEFLETSSGNNRFVIASEDSSKEFMILEDTGSAVTEVGSYDISTSQSFAEVATDGENLAWLQYKSPSGIYAIDITNRASPTSGSLSNTGLPPRYNNTTYDQIVYSTTTHGFFVNSHDATTNTTTLYYIGQDFTRATGGSYDYKRAITLGLDSTVSGGPHTDFPVVISEAEDYLKTTANGGKVYNENGYDIIFTSDSDGNTVLDHEIEYYDGATGEFNAWVKVSSLTSNTTIYMFYGNPDITSTQENIKGVWSNGYQMVSHMTDAGTGGVGDSVLGSGGWFKSGLNKPLQSNGVVGRGQYFDGTAAGGYLTIENNGDKQQKYSDFTAEVWIKPDSTATETAQGILYFGNGNVTTNDGWLFRHYTATDKVYFHMGDSATTNLGGMYMTNSAIPNDAWDYLAVTADRDVGYQAYTNTTAGNSYSIDSSAYSIGEVYDITIGRDYHATLYHFKGEIDEFRVSTTLRSTDWMTTGYNNVLSTSTFYSIGAESIAGGYNSPGYIYSSIFDLGSTDKELRSMVVEQSVPAGCGLSIDLEADTEATFTSPTVETFSDTSAGYYVSSTPATLNGKRYIRYKTTLTACNSNADTPTLYSVKFNYR